MGLIDEHLRTDVAAGDGAPGSGKPGPANDMQASNLKVNAIGDVLTVGYLAEGAIVPNTPEGRTALASSTELSAAFVGTNRDPMRKARLGLAAAATGARRFDAVAIGTSITEGEIASQMDRRWISRFQTILRGMYQPARVLGGEGYVPGHYAGPTIEAGAMVDRWTGGAPASQFWGLGYRCVSIAAGDSTSMIFNGTGLDLFFPHGPGAGTATITIDGVEHGTHATSATSPAAGFVYQVRGLRPGRHTVAVASAGGTTQLSGAMVYQGDEASGVHVWDAGHAGFSSTQMNAQNYPYQDLGPIAPQLVIIEPFANDYLASTNPATSKAQLEGIIAKVRANCSPSIILLGTAPKTTDANGAAWAPYANVLAEVAAEQGCLFVDIRQAWGNAFGDPNDLMYPGYDEIHPNDAGMEVIASAVAAELSTTVGGATAARGASSWESVYSFQGSPAWGPWTGASHDTGAYRVTNDDRVDMRGLLVPGQIADATTIFTFAAHARPTRTRLLNARLGNTATCVLEVLTTGAVRIYGASGSPAWLSLDGLSFYR